MVETDQLLRDSLDFALRFLLILLLFIQLFLQFPDVLLEAVILLGPVLLIFEKLPFNVVKVALVLFFAVAQLLEQGVASKAHLLHLVLIVEPLFLKQMAILS